MKRIIRLTESDLTRIVRRVIKENYLIEQNPTDGVFAPEKQAESQTIVNNAFKNAGTISFNAKNGGPVTFNSAKLGRNENAKGFYVSVSYTYNGKKSEIESLFNIFSIDGKSPAGLNGTTATKDSVSAFLQKTGLYKYVKADNNWFTSCESIANALNTIASSYSKIGVGIA